MRVGIATVYTPGIYGGAEFLADGLSAAVQRAGHSVHHIRLPFYFEPPSAVAGAMENATALDFSRYGGGQIDHMICLKFPTYLIRHPHRTVWLLHQHRSAYELYGGPYGWPAGHQETDALRNLIMAADNESLGSCGPIYTIAARVSQRLKHFNGIDSTPLYHPPANESAFYCAEALPYIFVPSRIETLKRQGLFLQAVAACRRPIQAVIAGTGSKRKDFETLAAELDILDRIRFVGEIGREELIAFYANAQAIFFGPVDEDYGYITLEAMLSGKPVITCSDSGGPLEFVIDGETGIVCSPEPLSVAKALDSLMSRPERAAALGRAGRAHYDSLDINWTNVLDTLLPDQL